ncbi:MAG: AAA family ATPase [candidate division Zixibacteria bacterium]|nr:AAA family ATPase [candidate division Zixibacteria bacterium]MDD5425306.1 AAA family ATPase [candidate division Zixibacteria bacterium]
MDIANYSSDSRAVIKNAKEVAATFRHPEIEVEHLLIATVRHEGSQVESILNALNKSPVIIESVVETYLKDQSSRAVARENLTVSPAVQQVLNQAIEEKAKLYDALVEPEHIFIAVFDPKSNLAPYVRDKLDITKEAIYRAIADSKSVEEITTAAEAARGEAGEGKKEVAGTLRYCIDLTNQAAAGEFDPVIGRDKEIQQTIQILLRRRKNSPILVGGPGVGKTAIVEGFSQAIIDKKVPKVLQDVKVMEVDMGSLVAGAKYKGEFEERFKGLISEVVKSAGKIILFIDEVHTIVGTAGGGGDAANLIKPVLARGQIRLIGATTEEEYIKYLEKDKALERRFEKIKIEEPNIEDSVRIVRGVISKYEQHHKIAYTPEALVGAVKFAKRYLSERHLPDVALDVIDEAGSEYDVKEEMAKAKIPQLEKIIPELEQMIKNCEGKDPEKNAAEFEKLKDAYDRFSQDIKLLEDSWGHRLDARMGGAR